ncbi:hypothetical protein PO124_00360 [Bacillus licheniformis]|nr:hypothetical protein [Bacillus licheniformis]
MFEDMKAMNLKVIRIWGFLDGQPQEIQSCSQGRAYMMNQAFKA